MKPTTTSSYSVSTRQERVMEKIEKEKKCQLGSSGKEADKTRARAREPIGRESKRQNSKVATGGKRRWVSEWESQEKSDDERVAKKRARRIVYVAVNKTKKRKIGKLEKVAKRKEEGKGQRKSKVGEESETNKQSKERKRKSVGQSGRPSCEEEEKDEQRASIENAKKSQIDWRKQKANT